jgi:predicted dienelactone hydrolase
VRPALLAVVVVVLAGCGGSPAAPRRARARTTTTAAPCARAGAYRVRAAQIRLTRRATTSRQVRHIDPSAWFPAGAGAGCRFPLIVFSHGANGSPGKYRPLLAHLASAGFVVIAPQHADRTARGDEAAERVADVRYVLRHAPALAHRFSPRLPGELDAGVAGVAGQSFGAFVAADEAATDPFVRAALVMAGPLSPGPAGQTRVPVLTMAGGADRSVPARLVRAYYARLPAGLPRGYLQIAGAPHAAYGDKCARYGTCTIVETYATSFFERYLDGDRPAGRRLDPHSARSPRVFLTTVKMP